jgi:hypothetical protein
MLRVGESPKLQKGLCTIKRPVKVRPLVPRVKVCADGSDGFSADRRRHPNALTKSNKVQQSPTKSNKAQQSPTKPSKSSTKSNKVQDIFPQAHKSPSFASNAYEEDHSHVENQSS